VEDLQRMYRVGRYSCASPYCSVVYLRGSMAR
jgi:hypothetical protein